MKTFSRLSMLVVATCFGMPAWAWTAALGAGQGASFYQVSYPGTEGGTSTSIGTVEVDLNLLRQRTGATSGYLNVATAVGWVIRNLPIPAEETYPYPKITSDFNLGVQQGTLMTSALMAVQLSDVPLSVFSATPATTFSIGARNVRIGGILDSEVVAPPAPPDVTGIFASLQGFSDTTTYLVVQKDHPNAEAALNQCMPMSMANSLQYLKDKKGLAVPHAHGPGLKGDNSLVGQLDTAMGRKADATNSARPANRQDPDARGTWGLPGKLTYLAQNHLAGLVETSHWGVGGINAAESGTTNVSITADGVTASSKGMGAVPDFDALVRALGEDQDCELVYAWSCGTDASGSPRICRHAVDVVGAGKILGQQFLIHASDIDQSSDTAGAGATGFQGEFIGSGWKLSGTRQVEQIICERYVPPPFVVFIIETLDPKGHSCCVDRPPTTLVVASSSTAATISAASGNVSWLPMTGTIAADGTVSLASTATVAGFSNVSSTFTGSFTGSTLAGMFTVGAKGELYGTPISWKVNVSGPPVPASPAIRVNGFRHAFTASMNDLTRISLGMQANDSLGKSGDWWMVAAGGGNLFSLDVSTMNWRSGLMPSYTGPLTDIPFLTLPFNLTSGLPRGAYTLYFGYDLVPNLSLDVGSAIYDSVNLTIQ